MGRLKLAFLQMVKGEIMVEERLRQRLQLREELLSVLAKDHRPKPAPGAESFVIQCEEHSLIRVQAHSQFRGQITGGGFAAAGRAQQQDSLPVDLHAIGKQGDEAQARCRHTEQGVEKSNYQRMFVADQFLGEKRDGVTSLKIHGKKSTLLELSKAQVRIGECEAGECKRSLREIRLTDRKSTRLNS